VRPGREIEVVHLRVGYRLIGFRVLRFSAATVSATAISTACAGVMTALVLQQLASAVDAPHSLRRRALMACGEFSPGCWRLTGRSTGRETGRSGWVARHAPTQVFDLDWIDLHAASRRSWSKIEQ
jgi:hypothetical protein